jgi:hypothetical protein
VDQAQQVLGVRLLLENPSTYLELRASELGEAYFLAEVQRRTGCGLLLDVINLYVSCRNHGADPHRYLDVLPLEAVGEIHLAGHAHHAPTGLLIDDHGSPVTQEVWLLYEQTLARTGRRATLIEWDNEPPPWPVLAREAARAQARMDALTHRRHRA